MAAAPLALTFELGEYPGVTRQPEPLIRDPDLRAELRQRNSPVYEVIIRQLEQKQAKRDELANLPCAGRWPREPDGLLFAAACRA
jgi:hypothetical protein